ncbi:MAG TPA: cytochrome c [Phenylobacterium sp.]|nr:cytochrome c [Phenylobacterium sp.]
MVRARFSTASLVLILALGTAVTAAAAAPVDRGRDLVRSNCGMCHAVGATDASPNELAPPFRVLHQRYPVENLEEALAEGILTGHPQMPEFRFSPDDVAAIIQYLKSIQTRQGAGNASPAPASRGR